MTKPFGMIGVAALIFAATAGSALATECHYFNAGTKQSLDGKCTVDYGADSTVIKIGERSFTYVEDSRQGQWSVGKLDGEPAARYEINREQYSYATLDLTVFIDLSE